MIQMGYLRLKKCIPETILREKIYSNTYNACMHQNKAKFSFVPFDDLTLYTEQDVVSGNVPDMGQAHSLVRQSGYPNFLCMRIPVHTQLNIEISGNTLSMIIGTNS